MVSTGIKIWSVTLDAPVFGVYIEPHGSTITAVTESGSLYALSRDGKVLWREALTGPPVAFASSGDGSHVAVATKDRRLHMYESTGRRLWRMRLKSDIHDIALSTTGAIITVGTESGSAYLIDKTGKVDWSYRTNGPVKAARVCKKGTYIGVGSEDHTVTFLNSRGQQVWKYTTQGGIQLISMDANGDYILACAADRRVYLFNRNGALLWNPRNPEAATVADMSDNANTIVLSSGRELLMFGKEGGLLRRIPVDGYILSAAVSINGEYGALGSGDDAVYFFTVRGDLLWNFKTSGEVKGVSITQDGELVVAGSADKNVYMLDNAMFFKKIVGSVKKKILDMKTSGINTLEAEVLLHKSEQDLKRKEYLSCSHYTKSAEKIALRLMDKAKPEISMLAVVYSSFAPDRPNKVNAILMNTGSSVAKNIRLLTKGQVELAGDTEVDELRVNAFVEISFYLTPRASGTFPVKMEIHYKDFSGREHVSEGITHISADATPQKYQKSKPVMEIGNIPKLVNKVKKAKKRGAVPAQQATTCPKCGRPVQSSWAGCPYCLTKLR